MTCYNCDRCGRYEHISRLGEFVKKFKISELTIEKSIWLCKWCLTNGKIKYKIIDGFLCVEGKKR